MIKRLSLGIAIVLALALGAYVVMFRSPDTSSTNPQSTPPTPTEVGVIRTQPTEVPFPVVYAGRVVGFRDVEVRPRVSGLLLKREYEEGSLVKQGQLLFQISASTSTHSGE